MAGPRSATEAFSRDNLIVERAQVQAKLGPFRNMVSEGDCATGAPLALADGDVLVEGCRTLDRRLVDLLVFIDGVRRAVARERALHGALASGAAAVTLLDVVLNERVFAPAVEGDEDGAGAGGCGTREGHIPIA